ncbi:hypothetical protein D3C77_339190 [compost metagenome]
MVDEQQQQVFQRDVAGPPRRRAPVRRQGPEAPHLRRHRHQGVERPVVAVSAQLQRQGEAQVGQEGEGVRRVDGHRRQHGEELVEELRLQPLAFGLGDAGALDDLDARRRHLLAQDPPLALLFGHQAAGGGVDLLQLLGRGQAVGRDHPHPLAHLALQAGHAGHEELVQIVGRDGQEAHPLQQRVAFVGRLFQHPAVEGQPRQLAVDEALGRGHQRLGQLQLRRARGGDFLAGGVDGDRRDISHDAVVARACDGCNRDCVAVGGTYTLPLIPAEAGTQ